MKTTLKNAIELAKQIQSKYNELGIENKNFFSLYHDHLLLQSDCAWEEIGEMDVYLKNKNKVYGIATGAEHAETSMQNLRDTLVYVTFIIDIQNQLNNCPKSIYG
jgi:hypothetical protein